MSFGAKYFRKFKFTPEQVVRNLENAFKDLNIAREVNILDVRFNYTYAALIKSGIALLSYHQIKVKSVPGHHIKIIDQMGRLLKDEEIVNAGNVMRSKRNKGFYGGGTEVTAKECREYLAFTEKILRKTKKIIQKGS